MSFYRDSCGNCGHSKAQHGGDQHRGACHVTANGYGQDCPCLRFEVAK